MINNHVNEIRMSLSGTPKEGDISGKNLFNENYAWGVFYRIERTYMHIKYLYEQELKVTKNNHYSHEQLSTMVCVRHDLTRLLITDIYALVIDSNSNVQKHQRSILALYGYFKENEKEIIKYHIRHLRTQEQKTKKQQRDDYFKTHYPVVSYTNEHAWPVQEWKKHMRNLRNLNIELEETYNKKKGSIGKKINMMRNNWSAHMGNLSTLNEISWDEMDTIVSFIRKWLDAFTLVNTYGSCGDHYTKGNEPLLFRELRINEQNQTNR